MSVSLSSLTRRHTLLLCALIGFCCPDASALLLKPGRYTFGVNGGFSKNHVNIGGGFGYMLEYGFQPMISLGYGYRNQSDVETHQVRTTLELRWYAPLSGRFTPYLSVEGNHVYMAWDSPTTKQEHNLFLVGGGGGLVVFVNQNIGIQFGVFLGAWVGAPERLFDTGVLEEAPVVTGRFGVVYVL